MTTLGSPRRIDQGICKVAKRSEPKTPRSRTLIEILGPIYFDNNFGFL